MVELSRALLTVMRFSAGSTPDCRLMLDWSGTARSAGSIVATDSSQGTIPAQVKPGEIGLAFIYFDGTRALPRPPGNAHRTPVLPRLRGSHT